MKERELLEAESREQSIEIIAEMKLTAEQLKGSLRALSSGFGSCFAAGKEEESEARVKQVALDYVSELKARVSWEVKLLPFVTEPQALAMVDARNARFLPPASTTALALPNPEVAIDAPGPNPIERLGQAEKVAEAFVERKIKPALRKAQETELVDLVKGTGSYLQGLWTRLNGGGTSGRQTALDSMGLPTPTSTRKEGELVVSMLSLELDNLERQLQEASKARENKLRKAGLPGRVQMAIELKGLDADVLGLSRQLAVRTLQLEMEFVYRILEDEALDVTGSDIGTGQDALLSREASTSELELLAADFSQLDEQLAMLAATLADLKAADNIPPAVDDMLATLAMEIPDIRNRVGVPDQIVFGGQGFSLTKLQLQVKESLDKVRQGVLFLTNGVRLLGSDLSTATGLFSRAALGGTLKPREVSALRRTARDLLTFIPFTIILLVPLTPLGHVLVFGFIQTYFPYLFPSCFSSKRQEMMLRYDDLKKQLEQAQAQAIQAEEDEELARVESEVKRLTDSEFKAPAAAARALPPPPPASPPVPPPPKPVTFGSSGFGSTSKAGGAAAPKTQPDGGSGSGGSESDNGAYRGSDNGISATIFNAFRSSETGGRGSDNGISATFFNTFRSSETGARESETGRSSDNGARASDNGAQYSATVIRSSENGNATNGSFSSLSTSTTSTTSATSSSSAAEKQGGDSAFLFSGFVAPRESDAGAVSASVAAERAEAREAPQSALDRVRQLEERVSEALDEVVMGGSSDEEDGDMRKGGTMRITRGTSANRLGSGGQRANPLQGSFRRQQ